MPENFVPWGFLTPFYQKKTVEAESDRTYQEYHASSPS